MTTPTGWDQSEGPPPDSPALGILAVIIALPGALCAPTYFLSPVAYLGAVIALPLGFLALGVPRSRGLGVAAVVLAVMACIIATAAMVSVGG